MHLCSLCNKEYPSNVETCPLEHCQFCGDTNMEIIPSKIVKDPIFILINTLFALLLVYSYFNQDQGDSVGYLLFFGVFIYVFGLAMYLGVMDRRPNYFCKNCRTTLKSIITKVKIGEFENRPVKKQNIQSPRIKKSHHIKEIIMIIGSIGSVITFILFLIPK